MREPVDHPAAPLAVVFCVLAFSLGLVGPAAAAFTPAMAKRQAPGPFAAAPIVQGGWADGSPSDTVIFASGTQISGTFYQTLDASQGPVVVWITRERNGNDGKRHDFFNNDSGTDPGAIGLRAQAGSLIFRVGSSAAEEVSANISGWVAGQRHLVVARWDNDNAMVQSVTAAGTISQTARGFCIFFKRSASDEAPTAFP